MNSIEYLQYMSSPVDISIIIPAKDEEKRIPLFLKDLAPYCAQSSYEYEIIVVDDGSVDQTSQKVKDFQKDFPFIKLIRHEVNTGKDMRFEKVF